MSTIPTNTDNMIDSRDVIEALAHLEESPLPAEAHALRALRRLAAQAADYSEDWEYGETLIRDSYFEEYARDLVDDCGYFSTAGTPSLAGYAAGDRKIDWSSWPYRCIDWQRVASELQHDYTAVDFDGVTYWVR